MDSHLGKNFLPTLLSVAKEVIVAIGLIAIFFFILQVIFLKLPKKKLFQILIGIAYTVVGLVVFLTAVSVGFMPIGYKMGTELASGPSWMIVVFGFILGTVVVLAEPGRTRPQQAGRRDNRRNSEQNLNDDRPFGRCGNFNRTFNASHHF